MLLPVYKKSFQKEVNLARKRGLDLNKLKQVIELLVTEQTLPRKYRDHALIGNYRQHRECHIQPDWLLIYKKEANTLIFERTGTHADLFN